MEQFIYPTLTAFFAALITWFFSRKSNQIDIEIKAANLYRTLLDDATKRLNQAIDTINERDEKIKVLMLEIELLTDELKKFKQLNGKS
jgi:hypothetical protein